MWEIHDAESIFWDIADVLGAEHLKVNTHLRKKLQKSEQKMLKNNEQYDPNSCNSENNACRATEMSQYPVPMKARFLGTYFYNF